MALIFLYPLVPLRGKGLNEAPAFMYPAALTAFLQRASAGEAFRLPAVRFLVAERLTVLRVVDFLADLRALVDFRMVAICSMGIEYQLPTKKRPNAVDRWDKLSCH